MDSITRCALAPMITGCPGVRDNGPIPEVDTPADANCEGSYTATISANDNCDATLQRDNFGYVLNDSLDVDDLNVPRRSNIR